MAEYYTVLKNAVGKLDANTADTRRTVYGEVRKALIEELKAAAPPLSTAEIAGQRLELEEAIRKVERESVANPQSTRAPARPDAPLTPNSGRVVRLPLPTSAPAEEDSHSPQEVFSRAMHPAQSRGSPAGVAGAIERAAVSKGAELNQYSRATADLRSSGEPVIERASPVPGDREPAEPPPIDKGAAARPRPADPAAGAERRRSQRRDDTTEATEREARPSRLRSLLLTALIIAVILGAGALAWSKRVIIGQIITAFDSSKATSGKLIPPTVPGSGAPGNVAERVTDAGPAPAEVVRPVNPRTDDAASPAAPAMPGVAATPAPPAQCCVP